LPDLLETLQTHLCPIDSRLAPAITADARLPEDKQLQLDRLYQRLLTDLTRFSTPLINARCVTHALNVYTIRARSRINGLILIAYETANAAGSRSFNS
jgi:hypothetical protein